MLIEKNPFSQRRDTVSDDEMSKNMKDNFKSKSFEKDKS